MDPSTARVKARTDPDSFSFVDVVSGFSRTGRSIRHPSTFHSEDGEHLNNVGAEQRQISASRAL
jgi:hypothetical protein